MACQSCVCVPSPLASQGIWANKDEEHPTLMQVPHMTLEAAARLRALGSGGEAEGEGGGEEGGVETVYALAAMDAGMRQRVLGCSAAQLVDVAAFCNRYPSIDVTFELGVSLGASGRASVGEVAPPPGPPRPPLLPQTPTVSPGGDVSLSVVLERDASTEGLDEGAGVGAVHAPLFPRPKAEGWWLVVGEPKTNAILALKRVTLARRAEVSRGTERTSAQHFYVHMRIWLVAGAPGLPCAPRAGAARRLAAAHLRLVRGRRPGVPLRPRRRGGGRRRGGCSHDGRLVLALSSSGDSRRNVYAEHFLYPP